MNREQWLTDLAKQMERLFSERRYAIRIPYKVTCGWPSRRPLGARKRAIGECHSYRSSKASNYEVFISPTLDKPDDVAGTLMHELVHVSVGTECGHKGQFVKACRAIGLVGKPTQAGPGPELLGRLQPFIERLGPYPHSAIQPMTKLVRPNNTIKVVCDECGCNFRMSPKWVAEAGFPTCGCGAVMESEQ